MKKTRRRRKTASAEAIARLAEQGKDISRFFTSTGQLTRSREAAGAVDHEIVPEK